MSVELRNAQRKQRLDRSRIKRIVQKLIEALGRSGAEVSILFVDDRQMLKLHEKWMQRATPTDVLSFVMGPVARGGPEILGDIVVSVETAARRARGNVTREVVRYLIHGLLHLIGYDHVTPSDRQRMTRESRRLQRIAHAVV